MCTCIARARVDQRILPEKERGVTSSLPSHIYVQEQHKTVQGQIMRIVGKLMDRHIKALSSSENARHLDHTQVQEKPKKTSLKDFTSTISNSSILQPSETLNITTNAVSQADTMPGVIRSQMGTQPSQSLSNNGIKHESRYLTNNVVHRESQSLSDNAIIHESQLLSDIAVNRESQSLSDNAIYRESQSLLDNAIKKESQSLTNNVVNRESQSTSAYRSLHTGSIPQKMPLYSCISSRTDSGVHANRNAMVIHLPDSREGDVPHDLLTLQMTVNKLLWERGEAIRIHSMQQVPDDFSCHRRAIRRHYIYRLGVIKDRKHNAADVQLPIIEREFCHIISPPFNVEKFIEAAEVISGTHNFTNFTTLKSLRDEGKSPIKTVDISVKRGAPIMGDVGGQFHEKIDFWEIHVSSRSFLYKQIRKIMHTMAAVASGVLSIDDLKLSLKNPDYKPNGIGYAFPPWGLFLNNVEYDPQDLKYLGPKSELQRQYRKILRTLDAYIKENSQQNSVDDINSKEHSQCIEFDHKTMAELDCGRHCSVDDIQLSSNDDQLDRTADLLDQKTAI